jgi:AcrR family transcriptional regulator
MVRSRLPKARRKRADRYHHGDLRRALVEEAARTIGVDGVAGLTLRGVGHALGVSRTALYRHFEDKSALLAAVAGEGFRTFRLALVDAWERAGGGARGFEAMGLAYVRFALTHSSHYRVMFGGLVDAGGKYPELSTEAAGAFEALVGALVSLQAEGIVRRDDPRALAQFVWAAVHGVAMLAIDGQLQHQERPAEDVARYAIERIRAAIAP